MRVELVDKMGSDLSVVNAARVSYSKVADEMTDKDEKLIKYLVEHNHWSPFAHAAIQFLLVQVQPRSKVILCISLLSHLGVYYIYQLLQAVNLKDH